MKGNKVFNTIKKLSIGLLFCSTPMVANADLTVRERNIAIGGLVIGAIAGNMMQSNTIQTVPMYNSMVTQMVPVTPMIPQCRVRQYRSGVVQECGPYGAQRIYPEVQYYGYATMVAPNVQIVYPRY